MNNPFVKKTVDGVMAAFSKAIADLDEVSVREQQEARLKREEAERLVQQAAEAEREAARAASTAAKLQSLIAA